MFYRFKLKRFLSFASLLLASNLNALTFPLKPGSDIIGQIQIATVQSGETLADIGRRFDVGIYEMIEANPRLDPWFPSKNARVIIPTQFILPPGPRTGIVLNLAELRLYFFHPDKKFVTTHPVGIGKKGWKTPIATTSIVDKIENPTWRPPKSIRQDNAKRGKILPKLVPPGPNNPLGTHALRLGLPPGDYLVHGTNRPGGIGVRVTSGCIRLFPADIASLYHKVKVGTQFRIIHTPYKLGWQAGQLFVEIHEPLSEPYYSSRQTLTQFKASLRKAILQRSPHLNLNWRDTLKILEKQIGYPIPLR